MARILNHKIEAGDVPEYLLQWGLLEETCFLGSGMLAWTRSLVCWVLLRARCMVSVMCALGTFDFKLEQLIMAECKLVARSQMQSGRTGRRQRRCSRCDEQNLNMGSRNGNHRRLQRWPYNFASGGSRALNCGGEAAKILMCD